MSNGGDRASQLEKRKKAKRGWTATLTFIRFLAARLGPNQSGAPSFCHLIEPISGHLIFYRLIGAHCAPKIISIRLLAAPKGVLSFVPIRFEIIIVLPCARLHVYILYIVVYFIFLFIIFFFAFFSSIHLPIVRHFQLQLPIFQCHWSSLTVIIVTVFRIVFEASHKSQVQRKQIIAQN